MSGGVCEHAHANATERTNVYILYDPKTLDARRASQRICPASAHARLAAANMPTPTTKMMILSKRELNATFRCMRAHACGLTQTRPRVFKHLARANKMLTFTATQCTHYIR